MTKTSKQVQSDIIALLKGSVLDTSTSGDIYRGTPDSSYRPRDSRKEDIVVIFTTGIPSEVETGVVTIQIYVPDITPYEDGVFVEDGRRTEEVEALADKWVDSLTCDRSNYKFKLQQSIHMQANPDIHQHFVVVRLGYSLYE